MCVSLLGVSHEEKTTVSLKDDLLEFALPRFLQITEASQCGRRQYFNHMHFLSIKTKVGLSRISIGDL